MKWVFLTTLVLVVGAVTAFGIWEWGQYGGGSEDERARAQLHAAQLAELCANDGGKACSILSVERVAPGLWRSEEVDERGRLICLAIDLDHFRVASDGETFHGVSETACPPA